MQNLSCIVIVLISTLSLSAQDLNTAWNAYVTTNAEISRLEIAKAIYQQEQADIKVDVENLRSGSVWYNAWLNKYRLANNSNRQLIVLDSLEVIEAELTTLEALLKQEMETIKSAYDKVLAEYESGVLPDQESIQTMESYQFRNIIRNTPILFPDYGDLLEMEWQDPGQRRLLLGDVQRLLVLKLAELDSIHTVREEEEELARRLAAFHADMGLQMEADQDAQRRDATGNTEKNLGWGLLGGSTSPAASDYTSDEGRNEMFDMALSEPSNLTNINVLRDDISTVGLEPGSARDLQYLQKKITEYSNLLEIIEQELDQTP